MKLINCYQSNGSINKFVESYLFKNNEWIPLYIALVTNSILDTKLCSGKVDITNTSGFDIVFTGNPVHYIFNGAGNYLFKLSFSYNALNRTKIHIDGRANMTSNSGHTSDTTSANLYFQILDSQNNKVAETSFKPTSKVTLQNFSVDLDISELGDKTYYIALGGTRNGNYWTDVYIDNLIIQ